MALKPDSFAGQIAELKIGDSYSQARRVPLGDPKITEKVGRLRSYLKNTMSPHVARAKVETGGHYTIETGIVQTHDNTAMLVVAVVTRLKVAPA